MRLSGQESVGFWLPPRELGLVGVKVGAEMFDAGDGDEMEEAWLFEWMGEASGNGGGGREKSIPEIAGGGGHSILLAAVTNGAGPIMGAVGACNMACFAFFLFFFF